MLGSPELKQKIPAKLNTGKENKKQTILVSKRGRKDATMQAVEFR